MASRRAINPSRRVADSGSIPLVSSLHQKSRTSSLLPIGLVVLVVFIFIGYSLRGSGGFPGVNEAMSIGQGVSCSADIIRAIPILKKAYGDSLRKVLHVGLDSCAVVSNLLKEKDTEAWGVEPFDLEDADSSCKSLYLNKTLPDIARVSSDGIVIFAGFPGQQRAKVSEPAKFGKPAKLRSSSWWVRYFIQTGLEENEMAVKKFELASSKGSYKPSCQIFHLSL